VKGSAATFSPTCFMATAERRPAMEFASAVSQATFSFTDHSAWSTAPVSFAKATTAERISEAGVPG
jgi:hypothetical protein